MPRARFDRTPTGCASRAILIALLERGELDVESLAAAAGILTRRASVILYSASIRGHVAIRIGRCAARFYSITPAGRDAIQLLLLARARMREVNCARARRMRAKEVA